jgi:bifunctional DNA-binding transcriptional regulator/antitoxin component of YhaV-PrlF toxin-antitoxin module
MTERGQVSIPAELRKEMQLVPGQTLIWERVSATECRVIVPPKTKIKPDPVAALGFAKRHGLKTLHQTTAEFMRELREGEDD